jgi:hypothetical protein
MGETVGHPEPCSVRAAFDAEDEDLQNIIDDIGDAPYTPAGLLPHQVGNHENVYPYLKPTDAAEIVDVPDFVDKKIDDDFLERIGMAIAKEISKDARENGCRRRPRANA